MFCERVDYFISADKQHQIRILIKEACVRKIDKGRTLVAPILHIDIELEKDHDRDIGIIKANADQIRTLDKSRLVKFIGTFDKNQIEQIDKATSIHLALF